MKTIENIKNSKVPFIIIDKRLNKLDNEILFPKKVEKAKEVFSKLGLPKK
jgi:hypothetical protein